MTKTEKEIVQAALSEYAANHQKIADRAASRKDRTVETIEHMRASVAMTILTWWRDIIKEPDGSVKI